MTWYVKLVFVTSILESGGVLLGWLWIVTRGTQLFHSPYLEVSVTIWNTKEAGAEILADAEVDRIALPRGTMGVQRPFWGGQVDFERVMAIVWLR